LKLRRENVRFLKKQDKKLSKHWKPPKPKSKNLNKSKLSWLWLN